MRRACCKSCAADRSGLPPPFSLRFPGFLIAKHYSWDHWFVAPKFDCGRYLNVKTSVDGPARQGTLHQRGTHS